MAMKPWYKVVTPREDLRDGKPLDASEFAIHLDHVREGRAPQDYQDPERFFERTYLTESLQSLSVEVIQRLSGEKTRTSAVFNLATQFGGGKTHSLALLYHLAKNGPKASRWKGVPTLLSKSAVKNVPECAVATFVGIEFDATTGRGGDDGTPLRRTPWGEIAFQLGGKEGFKVVARHDEEMSAPAGDVIRKFLPKGKPCLILMDELMNYISINRKKDMGLQLYNFLQNLSETARGEDKVVLAVSIPASDLEMNAPDIADYDRIKKLLDRLGKAMIMSAEGETSEIIRRRLFEWGGLPDEARKTITEYTEWILSHKQQLPPVFPLDRAREEFEASYPFHPSVISVFQRKWQTLPSFQKTRGVLRLLALWVSRAYQEGYQGAHKDPILTLGTAPLEDPIFRTALFEQLGGTSLEGAVTTDICGKVDAHAVRLDSEAVDSIRKGRLHRKAATAIFFESNGGMTKDAAATLPEVRLAMGEPDLDIGNVETVLEALTDACYYLAMEKNRYRFGLKVTTNKIFADRKASIQPPKIAERVRAEVLKVFESKLVERIPFPEKSGQIPDRAALALVIMAPERGMEDKSTLAAIEEMTKNSGSSARTFKSALIWVAADTDAGLKEEARKLLAWEDIADDAEDLHLDESQKSQVSTSAKKSERDLREAVWRIYKNVVLLGKDGTLRTIDMGPITSSSAPSLAECILNRLKQEDEIVDSYSPTKLVKNWPPAFKEWNTKAVRDAFYSSPLLPRLTDPSVIRKTIAQGVSGKVLAFVGKEGDAYEPFEYGTNLDPNEVDLSEDYFIIKKEVAEAYHSNQEAEPPVRIEVHPDPLVIAPGGTASFSARGFDSQGKEIPLSSCTWGVTGGNIDSRGCLTASESEGTYQVSLQVGDLSATASVQVRKGTTPRPDPLTRKLSWTGEIPSQKWMNFYAKVLTKFATEGNLKLTVTFESTSTQGIPKPKIEETKTALRELGLKDDIRSE